MNFFPQQRAAAKSLAAIFFCVFAIAAASATIAQTQTPTPSPALLVLNKSANQLAIVDPATKQVIARIDTGEGPHEVSRLRRR